MKRLVLGTLLLLTFSALGCDLSLDKDFEHNYEIRGDELISSKEVCLLMSRKVNSFVKGFKYSGKNQSQNQLLIKIAGEMISLQVQQVRVGSEFFGQVFIKILKQKKRRVTPSLFIYYL